MGPRPVGIHAGAVVALGLGAVCVLVAAVAGRTDLLDAVLAPPRPVGWMLGIACGLAGLWLLLRGADRVGAAAQPTELIRAIRICFLAVAAFAASAGWFLGSPVPIVAGLIIGGVDVLETTFLLLMTAARR